MIPPVSRLILATSAVLALGACERERVAVYTAPKDQPASQQHSADDGHDHDAAPQTPARPQVPKLTWTLPAGWQEAQAGQMSLASFIIKGDQGEASVTITPLMNLAGKEELVVNMWRQQVGQEPLSSEDAQKALTEIDVADGKGKVFEINGTREGKPTRIITAMQHRQDGASWFYKLSGDEAVVAAQKPAFLEFVKSVRIGELQPAAPQSAAQAQAQPASAPAPQAPQAAPQAPAAQAEPQFQWKTPEGWQQLQAGQMQVAKFAVPEQNGAKAEVAVSIFPSDTGGTLANVNRWRGQLGQPPVDEAGVGEFAKPLEGAPEGSLLVDLPGEPKRIIGAIVPREGRYWFYKMMGDNAAVTAAKDAFVAFAKAQP